mmetsp:Transcript_21378/g.62360  ORF Transcript_21378/g.62360 Transcript_21378/m.62360 type:complete len:110 (+) Transcript_21378:3522-3851(+)
MQPREYFHGSSNTKAHTFWLRDVKLFIRLRRISAWRATTTELAAADYVSITFTSQKNGDKESLLATGGRAIRGRVRWQLSAVSCWSYGATVPPDKHHWVTSVRETGGAM